MDGLRYGWLCRAFCAIKAISFQFMNQDNLGMRLRWQMSRKSCTALARVWHQADFQPSSNIMDTTFSVGSVGWADKFVWE